MRRGGAENIGRGGLRDPPSSCSMELPPTSGSSAKEISGFVCRIPTGSLCPSPDKRRRPESGPGGLHTASRLRLHASLEGVYRGRCNIIVWFLVVELQIVEALSINCIQFRGRKS